MSTPIDINNEQSGNASGARVADAELARRHHLPTQPVPGDEPVTTIQNGIAAEAPHNSAQSAWHFVHDPWLLAYYLFGVHRGGSTRLAIRIGWSIFYGAYGVTLLTLGQGGFYAVHLLMMVSPNTVERIDFFPNERACRI